MTIHVLLVSGGTESPHVWSDTEDEVKVVSVNFDQVARCMFDGDVSAIRSLLADVQALPPSNEREQAMLILHTALATASANSETMRTVNTPQDQLAVLREGM